MYIVYDPFYLKHDTGSYHPESPDRLLAIINALNEWDGNKNLEYVKPQKAKIEQVENIHNINYIKTIYQYSKSSKEKVYLDADTVVSNFTYKCAMLAAGGGIKGIDLILDKNPEFNKFFALIRPPGHHAFPNKGSGFCIFNNIAIAALHSIKSHGVKKIAIIDFDVHHGNGTQDIFYKSRNVFYVSFHQYPHYPGTGFYDEIGSGDGKGFNLNFPFAPLTGEKEYITAINEIVVPLMERFRPELLLVSAGYDSHSLDPLASLGLETQSYYKIMKIINSISNKYASGKLGIFLEGGYNTDTIGSSVIQTIKGCQKEKEKLDNLEDLGDKDKEISDRNKNIFRAIKNIFNID